MKNPLQRRVEQAIVSRIALFTSWWARKLPLRTVWAIADACGAVIIRLFPSRRRLAEKNLAATFPELSEAERSRIFRDSVRNICRTMAEVFRLPALTPEDLRQLIKAPDLSPIREALEAGEGVLIVSAHYGNWEWLGARLSADLPVPFTVIARDAAHNLTSSLINASRESHGMRVIGRQETRRMLKALHSGEMLGIVPDQHASQGGELLDFLGRPAWTFVGPATLAMRTGARVFPCFCVRTFGEGFVLEVQPEVKMVDTGDRAADLTENTRRVTAAIERAIRAHPEQWLWLHDRWRPEQPQKAE